MNQHLFFPAFCAEVAVAVVVAVVVVAFVVSLVVIVVRETQFVT